MNYNELEVRKTFELMVDDLTEVRIIGNNITASGYFKDVDTLLKNLKQYENRQGLNFYFVMNSVNEGCYSRQQRDCFIEISRSNKTPTTSDKDIVKRNWLLLDIDCERPSGVSSTDTELQKAKDKANKVYRYLKNEGFERPIVAYSGSGTHLLYRISLDPSETQLVKDSLLALDMMFSDEEVKIDTSVFNASRITKLYGTMAVKGRNTKERPHRLSKIVSYPNEIKVNDAELLIKLAKNLPEPPKRTFQAQEFDIDSWLSSNGIVVKEQANFNGGRKLILEECPFDSSHRGKDAAIFVLNNGAIGFKCFHASCSQYTWQDVRKKYEPNAYDRVEVKRLEPRLNSLKKPELKTNEPLFFTSTTIKPKDRSQTVSIETGITKLDKKIIGLNKGEVSCVSGLRGSGKSSLMSQIALEAVQRKYKAALFSGELSENRVLEWLQLQAAGKSYTQPTKYENYFYVDDKTKYYINKWLDNKIYIYNNNYGNDAQKILNSVEQCITKNKVDLVILDNLMSMNLESLSGDKYERQTKLALGLVRYAQDNDVHILFVAHPRKSIGFLRLEDISGTADLTNAVENVFIVHRVNMDFKAKSKLTFGWRDDNDLYNYTNVIEVCKNRDLGIQDYFVGLQFEVESKRFLNEKYETKHYDWEELQFADTLVKAPWD
jgi:KaiC/GvpD/RAD55 family RecA-like ATPase